MISAYLKMTTKIFVCVCELGSDSTLGSNKKNFARRLFVLGCKISVESVNKQNGRQSNNRNGFLIRKVTQ